MLVETRHGIWQLLTSSAYVCYTDTLLKSSRIILGLILCHVRKALPNRLEPVRLEELCLQLGLSVCNKTELCYKNRFYHHFIKLVKIHKINLCSINHTCFSTEHFSITLSLILTFPTTMPILPEDKDPKYNPHTHYSCYG